MSDGFMEGEVVQSKVGEEVTVGYPPDFRLSPPYEKPSYSFSSLPFAAVDDVSDGGNVNGGGDEIINISDDEVGVENMVVDVIQEDSRGEGGGDHLVKGADNMDSLTLDPEVLGKVSQSSFVYYSQITNEVNYSSPEKVELSSTEERKVIKSNERKISNSTRITKIKYDLNYFLKCKEKDKSCMKPKKGSSHLMVNLPKVRKSKKFMMSSRAAEFPSIVSVDSDKDNFEVIRDHCVPGVPDIDILSGALDDKMEVVGIDSVDVEKDKVKANNKMSAYNDIEGLPKMSINVAINRMPIDPAEFHPNVKEVCEGEAGVGDSGDELSDGPDAEDEKLIVDNYTKSSFWVRRIYGKRFVDYLAAAGKLVGNKNVIYLNSEDRSRIEITLKHFELVDIIIKNGLNIDGIWAKAYRLSEKPMDLLLSDIPSYVPNSALVKPLSKYGKIEASDITILRTTNDEQDWTHVVGFRRKALLRANKDVKIPDYIKIKYGFKVVKINIMSNSSKCFGCGKVGHMMRNCRATKPSAPPSSSRAPMRGIPLADNVFATERNFSKRPERNDTWADVARADLVNDSGKIEKWTKVKNSGDKGVNLPSALVKDKVMNEKIINENEKGVKGVNETTLKGNEYKTAFVKLKNAKKLFSLISHFKEARRGKKEIGVYPYHLLFTLDVKEALLLLDEERDFLEGEGVVPEIGDYIATAVQVQNEDKEKESKTSKKRPASSSDDMSGPAKANDFHEKKRGVMKIFKRE